MFVLRIFQTDRRVISVSVNVCEKLTHWEGNMRSGCRMQAIFGSWIILLIRCCCCCCLHCCYRPFVILLLFYVTLQARHLKRRFLSAHFTNIITMTMIVTLFEDGGHNQFIRIKWWNRLVTRHHAVCGRQPALKRGHFPWSIGPAPSPKGLSRWNLDGGCPRRWFPMKKKLGQSS